jgi:hypothetical protein
MKNPTWKYRLLTFGLLNIILLTSPVILLSRPKLMGTINIFKKDAYSERTVKVNGSITVSEQTITSPSVIETPFRGAELTVTLDRIGRINFGSDTKMNLAFDEKKIFGVLIRGDVTISVRPHITLNIQTKDGLIKVLNQNQENNVVIDFVGGKTRVKTLTGLATLNKTSITSGQYFIVGERNVRNFDSANKSIFFYLFIVPIRLTILSLLGDTTADLNVDSNQTNVGPVR